MDDKEKEFDLIDELDDDNLVDDSSRDLEDNPPDIIIEN